MPRPVVNSALVVLAASFALVSALPAQAQGGDGECRGTKKWYAGQCRYPEDIEAMRAEVQRQQADAARRKAEEERRKAEEERRKAEEERRVAEERAGAEAEREAQRQAEEREQASEPEPATPPPASADEPTDEAGLSPLVWIGFGIGGAGLLVGAITGAVSLSQASSLQDDCPEDVCTPDRQEDIDSMITMANLSNVGFVVAGVGAALGVVGIIISGDEEEPSGARLRPLLGPGLVGVDGRF